MSIGNWKDHLLVFCRICLKPMGHHVPEEKATCVDCERLIQIKNNKKVTK